MSTWGSPSSTGARIISDSCCRNLPPEGVIEGLESWLRNATRASILVPASCSTFTCAVAFARRAWEASLACATTSSIPANWAWRRVLVCSSVSICTVFALSSSISWESFSTREASSRTCPWSCCASLVMKESCAVTLEVSSAACSRARFSACSTPSSSSRTFFSSRIVKTSISSSPMRILASWISSCAVSRLSCRRVRRVSCAADSLMTSYASVLAESDCCFSSASALSAVSWRWAALVRSRLRRASSTRSSFSFATVDVMMVS
mmetsp:Transcript_42818/g.101882  ORF Transcript_42818/g.101882 Transcript_42818/m.101882 type:complete len:264 (+) Transcript_42818:1-792(+)